MKTQSVDAVLETLGLEASEPGREFVFVRCNDALKIAAHLKYLECIVADLIGLIHARNTKPRESQPA